MKLLAAVLLLLMPSLQARSCALTISTLPQEIASGHVQAFKLTMRHGAVTGMRLLPVAWHLVFNNDDNFIVTASGFSIVSAADLDPLDIEHLFSITPEPGYTCEGLNRLHNAGLTLTVDFLGTDFHTRRFTVDPRSISINE